MTFVLALLNRIWHTVYLPLKFMRIILRKSSACRTLHGDIRLTNYFSFILWTMRENPIEAYLDLLNFPTVTEFCLIPLQFHADCTVWHNAKLYCPNFEYYIMILLGKQVYFYVHVKYTGPVFDSFKKIQRNNLSLLHCIYLSHQLFFNLAFLFTPHLISIDL